MTGPGSPTPYLDLAVARIAGALERIAEALENLKINVRIKIKDGEMTIEGEGVVVEGEE